MRRIAALLGTAALVGATLAGCTATLGGGCTPVYSSGDASSIVKAKGETGSTPTSIDFPDPLVVTKAQVSQITEGKGTPIPDGGQVDFQFSVAQGKTGEVLGTSGYDPTQVPRSASGLKGNSVSKALVCAKVGERLALVTTVKEVGDAFGATALQDQDPKATLVVIIDVLASYPGKSDGVNQLPRDGMPTVVTAVDGTPGIQVPPQAPPKKTEISTIKAGSGKTIKQGDNAVVEYSIWTWPSKTTQKPSPVQSSWDGKHATTFPVDPTKLPKGIVDAIVGQKIGSQVLVVIPPGSDNFADGQLEGVDSTSTVIMVVDLLGLTK